MQGRIPVLGEYGGLGCAIDGHLWSHTAWGYGDKEVNRDVEAWPKLGPTGSASSSNQIPCFRQGRTRVHVKNNVPAEATLRLPVWAIDYWARVKAWF